VSNILRGNFKLVVDEKMQLSNKKLSLRVHCQLRQVSSNTPKKVYTFETKPFYVAFCAAQASNTFVKRNKDQQQLGQSKKIVKKLQNKPKRDSGLTGGPKKKLDKKDNGKVRPKKEKKTQRQKIASSTIPENNTIPTLPQNIPLSLPQSNENSNDLKSQDRKSDDDRSPMTVADINNAMMLEYNTSIAESVDSQGVGGANEKTQTRLSLIKSQANHELDHFTDSSEEETSISEEEEKTSSANGNHIKTQESVEIDQWIRRKFSTRGPTINNRSTVLEDKDLVIVVAYSDSDDDMSAT